MEPDLLRGARGQVKQVPQFPLCYHDCVYHAPSITQG